MSLGLSGLLSGLETTGCTRFEPMSEVGGFRIAGALTWAQFAPGRPLALSQRSNDEGVPALIRIARTNPDPELRKTALFWLGQSEDPRALDLFEEILR